MSSELKQPPASKSGPMVLVYIGNDDPTRGDSHGFKGIGHRMAQKLNGHFHYLENKHLAQMYPDIRRPNDGLKLYMKQHGTPDIVLSRVHRYCGMMSRIIPFMMVHEISETLSANLLRDSSLVSHHLTPEIFDEQGVKFRTQYKEITSPIIAVMLVNLDDIESFAQKMVSKCAHHDEMTVFICASRRTETQNYDKLKSRIEALAQEKGLDGRLKVDGYNFEENRDKENVFNPYIGLIKEADHIVVAGESLSMVSEPLAAGKTVMVFEPAHGFWKLKEKKIVVDFASMADDTRFETHRIDPVNVTEDISNKLIEKFNKVAKKYARPTGWLHLKAEIAKKALNL